MLAVLLMLACGDKDTEKPPVVDTTEPPAPPTQELDCTDGEDEDQDGLVDCEDSDCLCIETDCADGTDDDADGLTDCEDSDCLDVCAEVCNDGIDNDNDALTDCDDDECYGVDGCGGQYTLTTTYDELYIAWGWGVSTAPYSGRVYPFVGAIYGIFSVYAEPTGSWGGAEFFCSGTLLGRIGLGGGPDVYSYGGRFVETLDLYGDGYLIDFTPSLDDDSLAWDGRGCPIAGIPATSLGFFSDLHSVYRYEAGVGFTEQYRPKLVDEDVFYTSDQQPYTVRWLDGITVLSPPTWTGIYP